MSNTDNYVIFSAKYAKYEMHFVTLFNASNTDKL